MNNMNVEPKNWYTDTDLQYDVINEIVDRPGNTMDIYEEEFLVLRYVSVSDQAFVNVIYVCMFRSVW